MNSGLPQGRTGAATGTPGYSFQQIPCRSPSPSTGCGPDAGWMRRTSSPPGAAGPGRRDGALEAADRETSLYLGGPSRRRRTR